MKKKILFLHFDLGVGGAENVLVNLLNNLDPKKYDITLLLLFKHGVRLGDLGPHIKLKWVFNCKPFRGISQLLKLFSPKLLHKWFVLDKYDYEIAFLESIPTRIVSGCSNYETKCFSWVHRTFNNKSVFLHSYRSEREMLNCYKRFNGVAFVSETALDNFKHLTSLYTSNLQVVNNVLEVDQIIKMSKAESPILLVGKVKFCSVGRLTAQKDYARLLNALGVIFNEGVTDWHFYLLGQGEEKNHLEDIISKLHLDNNVTMVGFDSNPHRYVSKMDFYVCSSLYEGYSTSVTESVILHTPVLTTDCSGMAEIFGDSGCGLIVENTEEGLIGGLRQMLTDASLVKSMKKSAVERSVFFSKERCIKQFETFISI